MCAEECLRVSAIRKLVPGAKSGELRPDRNSRICASASMASNFVVGIGMSVVTHAAASNAHGDAQRNSASSSSPAVSTPMQQVIDNTPPAERRLHTSGPAQRRASAHSGAMYLAEPAILIRSSALPALGLMLDPQCHTVHALVNLSASLVQLGHSELALGYAVSAWRLCAAFFVSDKALCRAAQCCLRPAAAARGAALPVPCVFSVDLGLISLAQCRACPC